MTEEERRLTPEGSAEAPVEDKGPAALDSEESSAAGDDAFQEELANLQHEIVRFKELYLRKLADFDNYRKRQEREMGEFRRYAKADLMRDCLPVLDNLERALAVPGADSSGLREGVELVLRQFRSKLERYQVKVIESVGLPFDPRFHEAISQAPSAEAKPGSVLHELQKGYLIGDKLLRPAMVVVAAAAPAPTAKPADDAPASDKPEAGKTEGED